MKKKKEEPSLLKSLANPSLMEYSKIIRDFACSLSFLSTRAYNFVRKEFGNKLPHINTIRSWQKKVDGSPGFNKSIIPTIQTKISEAAKKGKKLKFSLQLDGMYINSTLEADKNGKIYGFVDYGVPQIEDTNGDPKIAKEALVFLINAVNDRWKAPVAYYFVNGVDAQTLAHLVEEVIYFLEANSIDVISLTLDGLKANIKMASYLGASITDMDNLKPYFYSLHGTKIHFVLDPCHDLKLMRNNVYKVQTVYDDNGDEINYHYLVKLNSIQENEGLRLGNKITKRHVNFSNEKMKVKLASQLFSKSVADSLVFLQSSIQYKWYFDKSLPTARFLTVCNNMFDILNSHSLYDAYFFKRAISIKNYEEIFAYLDNCIEYIKKLSFLGPKKEKVVLFRFHLYSIKLTLI